MNAKMDFSDVLASTLHDTKNSIGLLFNTLEEIISQCKAQSCDSYQGFYMRQYEIKRLNNNLIRLRSLYKASKDQFQINVDYHSVLEFFEDVVMQNGPVLNSKGIDVELDCSEDLFWTFDRGLLTGVVDNVINNAFRYTKEKVKISARQENGYLSVCIEDDGPGYPDCMLFDGGQTGNLSSEVNFHTGSTGLGLFFSVLVAKSHTNKDKEGFVSIKNGGIYNGGQFTIYIP